MTRHLSSAHIGEPTKSLPVPGNDQPHNPPFPANNTTVEFGRKEWKRYESNRNRSPGGRSGENRDTQGNQKNPPHPGGRPTVNIIDSERKVCLCGWKPGKQNFFIGKEKGTYIIFRRNPNILRRVSRNATPFQSAMVAKLPGGSVSLYDIMSDSGEEKCKRLQKSFSKLP